MKPDLQLIGAAGCIAGGLTHQAFIVWPSVVLLGTVSAYNLWTRKRGH